MEPDRNLINAVEKLKQKALQRRPPLHIRLQPVFEEIDALLQQRRVTLRDVADELGVSVAGLNMALRKLREQRRKASHKESSRPASSSAKHEVENTQNMNGVQQKQKQAKLIGPSAHSRSLDPTDL